VGDSLDKRNRWGSSDRMAPGLTLTTRCGEQTRDSLVLNVCSDTVLEAAHGFRRAEQFELHNNALR
jgi:hypothetical protein